MSLHSFMTQRGFRPVTIRAGWNRRLQRHYLIVSYADAGKRALYDSAADSYVTRYTDLPYYAGRLAALGMGMPTAMLRELARDEMHDMDGREVVYGAGGEIVFDRVQRSFV